MINYNKRFHCIMRHGLRVEIFSKYLYELMVIFGVKDVDFESQEDVEKELLNKINSNSTKKESWKVFYDVESWQIFDDDKINEFLNACFCTGDIEMAVEYLYDNFNRLQKEKEQLENEK